MSNLSNNDFVANALWQLFLVFVLLKLADKIDWSWWVITLPLTIPAILGTITIITVAIIQNRRAKKMTKDQLK